MPASYHRPTRRRLGVGARLCVALVVLGVLSVTASCRHRRAPGRAPRGPVQVTRKGVVDGQATQLARAIDDRLGGACPRRLTIDTSTAREGARALAEACVRAGTHLAGPDGLQRGQPFATGLVEVAVIAASHDEAEAVALRSLARLAFARGLLLEAVLKPTTASAAVQAFQEIEDAAPMELDPDTRRAIALVIAEHLLSLEGVDARAVLALASRTATAGIDVALARLPLRTDAETFFASVRATALSFHPPRAPVLSTVERRGATELLAQFDAKLLPSPLGLLVCGERYIGALTTEGDAFTVSFDEARCLDVDGTRIVAIEVGGLSTSPRGLDGAVVRRSFARAESPPSAGPWMAPNSVTRHSVLLRRP